jgi:hypothetical protein
LRPRKSFQARGQRITRKSPLNPPQIQRLQTAERLQEEWAVEDIISYFLDPTQPGYKLYIGITKTIFTAAVTGIFTDADLTLLNNYGNTGAGQTNGGSAANKGSTTNQTGQDSRSAEEQQLEMLKKILARRGF